MDRLKTDAVLSNDEYEAGLMDLMMSYLSDDGHQVLHVGIYFRRLWSSQRYANTQNTPPPPAVRGHNVRASGDRDAYIPLRTPVTPLNTVSDR